MKISDYSFDSSPEADTRGLRPGRADLISIHIEPAYDPPPRLPAERSALAPRSAERRIASEHYQRTQRGKARRAPIALIALHPRHPWENFLVRKREILASRGRERQAPWSDSRRIFTGSRHQGRPRTSTVLRGGEVPRHPPRGPWFRKN